MRRHCKLMAALGLALFAVSGALAETAAPPAQAPAAPAGYVNPFDPNWWLAAFNALAQPQAPGTAAPAQPQAAAPAAYPPGYVNPFDPNWWLAGWATFMNAYSVPPAASAQPAPQAPAPAAVAPPPPAAPAPAAKPVQGSAYVPMQTPYGPVYIFNFADPSAWNKLFAQPFAAPAPAPAK